MFSRDDSNRESRRSLLSMELQDECIKRVGMCSGHVDNTAVRSRVERHGSVLFARCRIPTAPQRNTRLVLQIAQAYKKNQQSFLWRGKDRGCTPR